MMFQERTKEICQGVRKNRMTTNYVAAHWQNK